MKFYDDQSSNKVNKYTSVYGSPSLSYSSQYLTLSGSGTAWNLVSPVELSTSDDWCFEADCMFNTDSNMTFCGIALSKKSTPSHILSFMGYTNSISSYDYASSPTAVWSDTSHNISKGNWYTFKWECKNNKLTYTVLNSQGNVITTTEINIPVNYQNNTVYPCITQYGNTNANKYSKNIKIKPL
jgi:hypothetical protein